MLCLRRLIRVFFLTGLLSHYGTASYGSEIAPATVAAWERLLVDAAATPVSPTANDLELRRQDLSAAITHLRGALASLAPAARNAWESYLHTEALEDSFTRSHADQAATLELVRRSLTADVEGLESDEVVALRTAAKNYASALARNSTNLQAAYLEQLQELRAAIRLHRTGAHQAAEQRIGVALAWLEDAGQAPDLVAAMRRHWSYPNAVVRIDTNFISQYVGRDINEVSMQRANVLGTQTRGPSQTFGRLELVSIENPRQAQVVLRMAGNTRSASNVGTNGPAVIYSSSSSHFDANKVLFFDPSKGLAAAPADTRCNASIGIRQIDVTPPVLSSLLKPAFTRAAWSKAKEQQNAVEKEVARLISRRIEQRLDEEMIEPLKKAQDYYQDYMIRRPLRIDEVPLVGSRSTSKYIELLISQARNSQLAASGPPPELASATAVGIALHQSILNNGSARVVWGGAEITDEDIEHYSQVATMHVPPALRVFSNSTPWSVTIDVDHPTTLIFENGCIDLTIHTVGWKIGEQRFDRKIDLHVKYAVENTRLGMTFNRVGNYEIAPLDGKPWTDEQRRTLLPHIEEKLAAFMQEQGRFNSLILPKGDGFGPLGNINLKQLECRDGWLIIGYQ
ncbi:MAG: hypothetical protein K8U03_10940 [Planctomycetia bacterium]|nr:hypothetical protein [Planctomycetia bacterium]